MHSSLIPYEDLIAITGVKRRQAQAQWFKEEFGVDLPKRADRQVIISWAVFDALQAQKIGILSSPLAIQRPAVCSPFE